MPKNRIIPIISFLVLLALLFWYFSIPERRLGLIEKVYSLGLLSFIYITIGVFGFILFQGFVLKHSVKPYGVHLKFTEHFGIIIVTFFSNYFIPFLGFGVRGFYLKQRHNLSYKDFSQSLVSVLVIEWAVFAFIAVIAATRLFSSGDPVSYLLTLFMLGIIFGFVFLFTIRPSWVPNLFPFSKFIKITLVDWQSYISHRKSLARVALYTFLEAICFSLVFVIAYKALFPDVPFAASVFAASLSDLALVIRLLPAAAGSLEGALHLAMMPYGIAFDDNVSIAIIIRVALAVIFVPLGPPFFWWLIQPSVHKKD